MDTDGWEGQSIRRRAEIVDSRPAAVDNLAG